MDIRRKKLRHRAQYRGFREADILIGRFANAHIEALSEPELDQFEALLAAPDQDAYAWIMELSAAPSEHDNAVLARLRKFRYEHRGV